MSTVKKTETITEEDNRVDKSGRRQAYSVFDQTVFLILGIIEVLLLVRFAFRFTGANPASGIVSFVYSVTDVLMAPFRFIFPTNTVEGATVEWSVIVAIIFYALVAWIIMKIVDITFTGEAVLR